MAVETEAEKVRYKQSAVVETPEPELARPEFDPRASDTPPGRLGNSATPKINLSEMLQMHNLPCSHITNSRARAIQNGNWHVSRKRNTYHASANRTFFKH